MDTSSGVLIFCDFFHYTGGGDLVNDFEEIVKGQCQISEVSPLFGASEIYEI